MRPSPWSRLFSKGLPAALLTGIAFAGTMLQAQEPTQPEGALPKLVESIDIRVISIDVVVTDRKGKAIKGLTLKDFVLYENGSPKPITNFYEVGGSKSTLIARESATPAEAPAAEAAVSDGLPPMHLRRRFILFIDNLSLHPFRRNAVFKGMKEFVETAVRPGDQAMIATWNRSMKVRLAFTGDVKQIQQTLDAIAGESGLGVQAISERRSFESRIRDARNYDEAIGTARSYASSVEHDTRQTIDSLKALMSTVAGVEGKKALVLTSQGLPMIPGHEMFVFVDEIGKEKGWANSASSFIEASHFNVSNLMESVARAANANNITVYALHAGGLASMDQSSAENQTPVSLTVEHTALTNSTDSMSLLANMTGGLATFGTNNFKLSFERIEQDMESYYSLGYRSGTERIDRQRSVEVKAMNRNYVVRSRRSFVEKSTETEMNERVIANLFHESDSNDLGVFITTGKPRATDAKLFSVPIEVHIPMDKLTMIPQGEIVVGGFSVYVGVSDKNGDMSEIARKGHQIRIQPAELEATRGKFYTFELELIMEGGRNRISVGVVDEISNETGFKRQEVLAKDLS